jgi:hypothetical protein
MPCWHYQIHVAQSLYDMTIFDSNFYYKDTTIFGEGGNGQKIPLIII